MFSKLNFIYFVLAFAVTFGATPIHGATQEPGVQPCPGFFARLWKGFRPNAEAPVSGPLNFNFAPHTGTPSTAAQIGYLEMHVDGASYFELGRGGGGVVVRVVPPPGSPPFLLKHFFKDGRREIEERAMVQLEKDSKNVKSKIQFVRPTSIGRQTARLEDVQGRTLQSLLSDKMLSPGERAHLLREWNAFVLGVRANVHKKRWEIWGENNGVEVFNYTFEKKGFESMVFLKPDNVIVESGTGRMYILDAY